ncbi:MAG: UDP-N-acetylmuramate:L-alanyl-gamma-D-glutamyl-meso-diaminopimelate ligase [Ectothiorhodospiraceae bacterium]|nr:UDP-N-acetylmuramate:L-alanyl-gamma-D-glutamyl-meso-diaminopimelate ligase [Ectothiorhodospiraceae bacterium]
MKKRLYFIGLCGTAMAGAAVALKQAGYEIDGSDEGVYPPMSTYLETNGITCRKGFSTSNLEPPPDLVVIGNAMSRGNPEVEHVLNSRIPFMSLPALIREYFIADRTSIVVAGTHGKTSTTSLVAWLFEFAGESPGFMIGGVPKDLREACRTGKGSMFIVEGDEYDTAFFDKRSKFVHYAPHTTVINNIEFDHADIFRDLNSVKQSFRQLVNLIPGNGLLLVSGDDTSAVEVSAGAHTNIETFGFGERNDWLALNTRYSEDGSRFQLTRSGNALGEFVYPFAGAFHVRNAMAAIAVAVHHGIPVQTIRDGLRAFRGVKRRMDIVHDGAVTVIDDFAHHPTAIRETLTALRLRYPGRRLWAIFEPRSNTSTRNLLQQDLHDALAHADVAIIGPINRPERYSDEQRLDPEAVASSLEQDGILAAHIPDVDEIISFIESRLQVGDVLAVMSNGSFGGIHGKIATLAGSIAMDNGG